MIDAISMPARGQRWLSRPPYLLVAHILRVDQEAEPPLVSYALRDQDGWPLVSEEQAVLDEGWWHAFQPIRGAYG